MGSSSFPVSRRATFTTIFALGALVACSLTKKEEPSPAASTPTTVIMGAAPVFNVATPQGSEAAPLPATGAQDAVATAGKTKTGTGGATSVSTTVASGGAKATATTAGAGGTSGKSTASTKASTTPAAATTAAPVPALPQVDTACVGKCTGKMQTCLTAAGVDTAKIMACQSVLTACQSDCPLK